MRLFLGTPIGRRQMYFEARLSPQFARVFQNRAEAHSARMDFRAARRDRGEVQQIHGVVDNAGRPLDVVASAATGTRGPGSDIDYTAPPGSLPYFDPVVNPGVGNLPGLDPNGGVFPGGHNPFMGPGIHFEPGAPPVALPAAPD